MINLSLWYQICFPSLFLGVILMDYVKFGAIMQDIKDAI